MENNDELSKNLALFLKMFKNRPYHLAKYLIDNSALSSDFINKIIKSHKLKEINEKDEPKTQIYFNDISKMEEFYTTFLIEIDQSGGEKSIKQLTSELNTKLNDYIKSEKYEDAARIRDYMTRNGIKRIKN